MNHIAGPSYREPHFISKAVSLVLAATLLVPPGA